VKVIKYAFTTTVFINPHNPDQQFCCRRCNSIGKC